jgi:predicted ATP-grasp superfamily ATP-dependent carboligase
LADEGASSDLNKMTSSSTSKRPVLILGMEPRITIPVARSLRRYGVPVEVASLSLTDPAPRSRCISHFVRLAEFSQSSSGFCDALLRLISERGYDMIMPVTDAALAAVSEQDDRLRSQIIVGCPARAIVQRVLNKAMTLEIAQKCGIRVPRSYRITNLQDLQQLADRLEFPVVAKPYHKSAETDFKVRYFNNFESLRSVITGDSEFPHRVLLQEYCPGDGVGIEMLIHNGRAIATFQHRRIKEFPHTGGASVVAIAESLDAELVEQALTLLRALKWEGIAMVEFRFNRSDRRIALMEVNGRYWGTIALPIKAGIDFPVYEYQIAHGENPSVPKSYRVGTRWRWTSGYVRRMRGLMTAAIKGSGRRSKWIADLLQSPLDFLPPNRDAIWSWGDPGPATYEFLHEIKRMTGSNLGAAIRRTFRRRAHPSPLGDTQPTGQQHFLSHEVAVKDRALSTPHDSVEDKGY